MRRVGIAVLVLWVWVVSEASWAGPAPGGLVYAVDTYAGGQGAVAIRPDGTGFSPSCQGDVTGGGSSRRFLRSENAALVWSDGTCVSQRLSTESGELPRWSPSGGHVAFGVRWTELDQQGQSVTRYGIRVGDVVVGHTGLTLVDVRLAVALPAALQQLRWASDAAVVFAVGRPADLYYASVTDDDLGSTNVTASSEDELYPSVSPDGQRIAFARATVVRGAVRTDIFTMPILGGAATRVTSKSNTPSSSNVQPSWSPDGGHIAFACRPTSLSGSLHVCRIGKDGSTKAVDLTPKTSASFSVTGWGL